jgi:hypothetical protein
VRQRGKSIEDRSDSYQCWSLGEAWDLADVWH